jgi:hypothetical protein
MAKFELVLRNLVMAVGFAERGSAYVYSDAGDVQCPLCRITVPKGQEHRCERRPNQTNKPPTRKTKRPNR